MNEIIDKDAMVQAGSGDVFADLGISLSHEDKIKIGIASVITATISKRRLTQAEAGKLMGIDQPKVSALLRGRLSGFSVERLVLFLLKLGRNVEIKISREFSDRQGEVRVKSAALG